MAGASIVGASVLVLAYKLTIDAIRQERAAGRPFGAWRIAFAGLGALLSAVLIIGVADLTFLFIYDIISVRQSLGHRVYGQKVSVIGLLTGQGVVIFTTSQARRLFRKNGENRDLPKPNGPSEWPLETRVYPSGWLALAMGEHAKIFILG